MVRFGLINGAGTASNPELPVFGASFLGPENVRAPGPEFWLRLTRVQTRGRWRVCVELRVVPQGGLVFSAVSPSARQLGGFPGPRRPPHCQQRSCEENQSQGKVPPLPGSWYPLDKLLPRAVPLQPRETPKPSSQAERAETPSARSPRGTESWPCQYPRVRPELLAHRLDI